MVDTQFKERLQDILRKLPPESIDRDMGRLDELSQLGLRNVQDLRDIASKTEIDGNLRALSCWFLGRLDDEANVDTLIELSNDAVISVRASAVQSLANFDNNKALMALAKSVEDASAEVRKVAIQAISWMKEDYATKILIKKLIDENEQPDIRGVAAEALGNAGKYEAVQHLVKSLRSDYSEVRFWSAFALGELCAQDAIEELQKISSDMAEIPEYGSVGNEARQSIMKIRACNNKADNL